jgi:ribosomal protein S18 acetylase RimI-like enzyme
MTNIQPAGPQDATAIYEIKKQAFTSTSLRYSIYQSPRSIYYLKYLIAQSPDPNGHNLWIARDSGNSVGYYHAIMAGREFFLNYIAVDLQARGRGIGDALLRHFELTGKKHGARQLALEAFELTPHVLNWYENNGYRRESTSFHVCFSLDSLARQFSGCLVLVGDEEIEQRASYDEQQCGFSKIDYACGSGKVTVGLIADRACKLLGHEQVTLEEALSAICSKYKNTRDALIISSLERLPEYWEVSYADKVFRLTKPILLPES